MNLNLSEQSQLAEEILESGQDHTLIIGRAGTGKSTLLSKFREQTKKKLAVLAPTGVAALNVKGETIHSFFKLRPGAGEKEIRSSVRRLKAETLRIYKELECLVIDEISMVRADLFDQMDLFLQLVRKNKTPFGGVRVIMFGDLYQLPPVVKEEEWRDLQQLYKSPYFFSSQVWQEIEGDLFGPQLTLIELTEIYRQKDPVFIDFLNSVRNKNLDLEQLLEINRTLVDESLDLASSEYKQAVVLTTTNKKADKINQWQLGQIESELKIYKGKNSGKFEAYNFPTSADLALKRGARIMLLNNDSAKRWVNGTMGWVADFIQDKESRELGILARLDDDQLVEVFPYKWEMTRSFFNVTAQNIEYETVGSYEQLPVKLAWAITIHKSQGKTFEQVVIDLDWAAFATGQTYVALSRCTSLKGIKLIRPLRAEDILLDEKIIDFLNHLEFILGQNEARQIKTDTNSSAEKKLVTSVPTKREVMEGAILRTERLKITYLGSHNSRQERFILPRKIAPMTYAGQSFTAITADCETAQEQRIFNFDRILKIEVIE